MLKILLFTLLFFLLTSVSVQAQNQMVNTISDSSIVGSWVLSEESHGNYIYVPYVSKFAIPTKNVLSFSHNLILKIGRDCHGCCTYEFPLESNWDIKETGSEKFLFIQPFELHLTKCTNASITYKIIKLSSDQLILSGDLTKLKCQEN